jgi:hypothetical protein
MNDCPAMILRRNPKIKRGLSKTRFVIEERSNLRTSQSQYRARQPELPPIGTRRQKQGGIFHYFDNYPINKYE